MINKPNIKTAIPKKRYRLGEFNVVILGDIETGDANAYLFIAAILREGDPEPGIYLTAERNPPSEAEKGRYGMRLIMKDGSQWVRSSDDWRDLQTFTSDALEVTKAVLNLSDEEAFPLM